MKQKTFKREAASLLFIWLAYVTETKDAAVVEVLVWPVFTFGALAFGLDWFNKSGGVLGELPTFTSIRGWTQRSSEHTVGPREQSDNRSD